MLRVIFAEKGAGKTKRIIEEANELLKTAKGTIAFIDDDKSNTRDIHYNIRFIDASEYSLHGPEMFLGFICGIAAQDFDLEALSAYLYATLRWQALASLRRPDTHLPDALNRALKYLDANYVSNITPEDAAESAGISRPYLFRMFREHLRTRPHQYLLKRRLDRAKLLLAGETFSIKEIASDCGFESIEVFYRQFRSSFRTTPAEYRKQYSIHLQ